MINSLQTSYVTYKYNLTLINKKLAKKVLLGTIHVNVEVFILCERQQINGKISFLKFEEITDNNSPCHFILSATGFLPPSAISR